MYLLTETSVVRVGLERIVEGMGKRNGSRKRKHKALKLFLLLGKRKKALKIAN